ncbi:hypothetical protein MUP38_01360, partial [Candidatus Bathyarchaeota archaeon]|nr:hypothetical protein [Candidatus Bathyarchaeota archaeon]
MPMCTATRFLTPDKHLNQRNPEQNSKTDPNINKQSRCALIEPKPQPATARTTLRVIYKSRQGINHA